MNEYCVNSESNLQIRTVQHAKGTSSEYCKDWKEAHQRAVSEETTSYKMQKQNHFLAASSRTKLEVTITLFLH